MEHELLSDKNFWEDLYRELNKSKKKVYMQFMTFEGDKTGLRLASKLIELKKRGVDVKVLIDRFTDYYVSDTYYKNPSVKKEVISTKKMIQKMEKEGIKIKRTRPYGFLKCFFLARNHKKIIIIDDFCYLGGINISDHNFSWHDFMVKINKKDSVKIILEDFKNTFNGKERDYKSKDVFTNKFLEELYYSLIIGAKKEIIISSPYVLDISLIRLFKKNMNAKKILLTLKKNNYNIINKTSGYLNKKLKEDGAEIFNYPFFSHAKFLLVDREKLLIGSSNFGQESFLFKQEIGILIKDKKFINGFVDKMYEEHKHNLIKYRSKKENLFMPIILVYLSYFLMQIFSKFFFRGVKPIG